MAGPGTGKAATKKHTADKKKSKAKADAIQVQKGKDQRIKDDKARKKANAKKGKYNV